jgi:hypothetical protein
MYGRGIQQLLDVLPSLDGLDSDEVRRLLSRAWLDVAETRELDAATVDSDATVTRLRRLALALQIHAVLLPDLPVPTQRASSFVAAESLDIVRELLSLQGQPEQPDASEQILTGLLYLIAGYDANAAVAVRHVSVDPDLSPFEQYTTRQVLALLRGDCDSERPAETTTLSYLHERVRAALQLRIGDLVASFNQWLRTPDRASAGEADQLLALANDLRIDPEDVPVADHGDLQHLARVLSRAMIETSGRAARAVPAPPARDLFDRFLERRCRQQPVLWPAAAEFAATALGGDPMSAVVAVPTGAGKSAVADLAIQHAIRRGWVAYLAPTNALVGQIRRQLRRDHPGVAVRQFLGGSEYTSLPSETLDDIAVGQVLVMTPEKCSLALRVSPDAFDSLALVVLDEAHVLGEKQGRGALTELVLAEIATRARDSTFLFMSALVSNPDALSQWIADISAHEVTVIREPWRPTRTLRAVVGIDRAETIAAADAPTTHLASLPVHRRNVSFDGHLAVLAGLHGPWSSRDPRDYAVVKIGARTPMTVTRPRGGGDVTIEASSAKVRETVESLAQMLGEREQKVMAFLTRSRHDCFTAALALPGFGEVELGETVAALLALASAELGVETQLKQALSKGVGVHTSALLTEERRASELSFDEGAMSVLFATGTLAQGLNLPATTVIVGGTEIGYDPEEPEAEKRAKQRSQLLNAIGRAGRARVAARSLALVVPNRLPVLEADTLVDGVIGRAEFLAEEDASTELASALTPLLDRLQTEPVDISDLSTSDHVVLSYLAATDDGEPAVLRNTWGIRSAGVQDVESTALAFQGLVNGALTTTGSPAWVGEAARRAGVALPVAAHFAAYVSEHVDADQPPSSVEAWMEVMLQAVETLDRSNLWLLLQRDAFRSTAIDGLWAEETGVRRAATDASRQTLRMWLQGDPLADVGGAAHGTGRIEKPGRGQRDPLPRTIRLVETGIGFGLVRAAGLLAAVLDVAAENGAPAPAGDSRVALERLPLALRFGAGNPMVLSLLRAGARPRAVAVALGTLLPTPDEGLDDAQMQTWASTEIQRLAGGVDQMTGKAELIALVRDFLTTRDQT